MGFYDLLLCFELMSMLLLYSCWGGLGCDI